MTQSLFLSLVVECNQEGNIQFHVKYIMCFFVAEKFIILFICKSTKVRLLAILSHSERVVSKPVQFSFSVYLGLSVSFVL